ncbi:MAG: DUF4912 domain-containing protein [Chthoniobacterales bacterium]
MNETEYPTENPAAAGEFSFRISDQPVVETRRAPEQPDEQAGNGSRDLAAPVGDDALHMLARDPRSLFVYWTLDWDRRFAVANLAARPVHLRIFREDESEETTTAIDPRAGFTFVDVSAPGAGYRCEIGCCEGEDWKTLARSEADATPAAAMSDDLAADFATLPLHLSFQRLIDIFRANPAEKTKLSQSVAHMQSKARTLQASMSPEDWSQLVDSAEAVANGEKTFGLRGVQGTELAALLRTVNEDGKRQNPSPENLARWRQLGERFGGSSWSGGASERNGSFGSSSLGGSS